MEGRMVGGDAKAVVVVRDVQGRAEEVGRTDEEVGRADDAASPAGGAVVEDPLVVAGKRTGAHAQRYVQEDASSRDVTASSKSAHRSAIATRVPVSAPISYASAVSAIAGSEVDGNRDRSNPVNSSGATCARSAATSSAIRSACHGSWRRQGPCERRDGDGDHPCSTLDRHGRDARLRRVDRGGLIVLVALSAAISFGRWTFVRRSATTS